MVSLFRSPKRRRAETEEEHPLGRRLSAMRDGELVSWAETSMYGISRALADRDRGHEAAAEEALHGARTLVQILEALRERG